MDAKFVIRNGELIKKEDANISVYNKALFFDFSVYSNVKVVQGKMFCPDSVIQNLFDSAKTIGIQHNFKQNEVWEWIRKLVKENNLKDALIRMLLIGQEKNTEPLLFLFPVGLTFHPEKLYNQGAKLITFEGERFMPNSKTKNLLMSYMAYTEAAKNGAIDALLVDRDGNIQEGTRSSFFVIKGNTLIAPPKQKVLQGMTRKTILDIAKDVIEIKEEDIPLAKIKEYDEYLLSGTSLKLMPIRQINEDIVMENVGPKIKELQKLFKEYSESKFVD
jgi:branched-subunit amino acid aminotransferase/4-amino-4-deoxychorismate lyase|tara:strand:+ start:10967 stop:11791 length:825 start_codon:yes stop_codon:yes gene_type:complete